MGFFFSGPYGINRDFFGCNQANAQQRLVPFMINSAVLACGNYFHTLLLRLHENHIVVKSLQCLRLMVSLSEFRWVPLWGYAEVEGVSASMPGILV